MTSSAREKYLSLCYINSRSVKNKTLYLNDYITTHDHDLVAFSETWFNSTDDNDPYISALLPDGYDIRHVDREQGKRGGGVALIYKNSIKAISSSSLCYQQFESMIVTLSINNKTVYMFVLYRPPPSTQNGFKTATFFEEFSEFISEHVTTTAEIIIVGDLNLHLDINTNPHTRQFTNLLACSGLKQHDILLSKLGYYGVSGVELRLLSNYLSDRVQYVEYLGAISQSKSIGVGVPQGSILGPLLFLIYINDLPNSSDMFNILMYADDTTLFCNFDTTCNSEKINSELEKIYRWLCSNKLSLNVGKTKFACFHTAQRIVAYPELKINNVIIDRVTEFNFLGLIISSNMKWKKHIDHIALKVSKIIGIMYRLKFILPADVLLTIYNSLILPHFNYCHLAWGSNITAGHKLHLLQKKAVRIVDHRHFLAHTEPICKRLRIVKIVDMFQISIWKFYYKLMNNMLPSYFEYMKPVQPVACNYYGIRKPRLHPPIINHEFGEQMVQYCLIKILNEDNHETTLNKNNIYSQSFFTFKVTLKINKINSYSDTCNIRDCNICKMDQENE